MFIRDLKDCLEITAGDNCKLKELFNPLKDDLDLRYSLAHAIVKPGDTTFNHKLKTSEVYYILQGEGLMYIERETKEVYAGQAIYVPPGHSQKIKNTGNTDLIFLVIVDPAWKKEDEVVYE
ncbi:MAG: cupin domain-containing protein [Candidatus Micrarchaeota archaeon]